LEAQLTNSADTANKRMYFFNENYLDQQYKVEYPK